MKLTSDSKKLRSAFSASDRARSARRISNAAICLPPGIDELTETGKYTHPDPPSDVREGILLTKPGWQLSPELLAELCDRAAECGYTVRAGKVLEGRTLARAAAVHYHAHLVHCREGKLTAAEYARLLAIYNNPRTDAFAGRPAIEIPVRPAAVCGLNLNEIAAWSAESARQRGLNSGEVDGPNEIGDHLFVNLHARPNPIFIVNPHMLYVMASFEIPGTTVTALHLQACRPNALAWALMRQEFLGCTDPALASPGSLRGDAFTGVLPLAGPQGGVSRIDNGFHLSSGPVEAVREIALWLDKRPGDSEIGKELKAGGIEPSQLLKQVFLVRGGHRHLTTEITNGYDPASAARVLKNGALATTVQDLGEPTRKRLAVASCLAKELTSVPGVRAVLATGSTAMGRAAESSDLDLVILHESLAKPYVEMTKRQGITIEMNHFGMAEAYAAAAPSKVDLKALRESARLSLAVGIHDPYSDAAELEVLAQKVVVPASLTTEMASQLEMRLNALLNGDPTGPRDRHEWFLKTLDSMAMIVLTRTPIRFHKARWVMADLTVTGNVRLRDLILRANGGPADPAVALASAGKFLDAVAFELKCHSWRTVVDRGFAPEIAALSYTCRTLADAESLAAEGDADSALYTARYAARLGAMCWGNANNINYEGVLPHVVLATAPEPLLRLYVAASAMSVGASDNKLISSALALLREEFP